MSATYVDGQGRVRKINNDALTQIERSRDGQSYDLTPRFDAGGKLSNGDRLAPSVAAQFGYKPAQPSAYELGARDGQQAADYMRGRDTAMGVQARPSITSPGVIPGNAQAARDHGAPESIVGAAPVAGVPSATSSNPYTFRAGGSSLERTRTDGMAIGNDGQPYNPRGGPVTTGPSAFSESMARTNAGDMSRWQVSQGGPQPSIARPGVQRRPQFTPEEIANGASVSYDPQPGIPAGHGVIGGPGKFFISAPSGVVKDEKGKKRQFASMDEVNAYFGSLSQPPAAASAPGDSEVPGEDPQPEENDSYLSTPLLRPAAPAAPASTAPAVQAAAAAWNGQGGMMPRPSISRPAPALTALPDVADLNPQPAAPAVPPSNDPLLQPQAYSPIRVAAIQPPPAMLGRQPTRQPAPAPGPGTYQPAPVADMVERRLPGVASAFRAVGSVLNPPTAAWNMTTPKTWDGRDPSPVQPKQYQAAADRYNPFTPPARNRRTVTVLPE